MLTHVVSFSPCSLAPCKPLVQRDPESKYLLTPEIAVRPAHEEYSMDYLVVPQVDDEVRPLLAVEVHTGLVKQRPRIPVHRHGPGRPEHRARHLHRLPQGHITAEVPGGTRWQHKSHTEKHSGPLFCLWEYN